MDTIPDSPKIDQILEADQDAKQIRKTGKESGASATQLARFGLNETEMEKFYSFSESVQAALIEEPVAVVRRLMGINEFSPSLAESFMSYSKEARDKLLAIDDKMMIGLLADQIEEEIIIELLNPQNIQDSMRENIPGSTQTEDLDLEILTLGDELRESGNLAVFDEVEKLNGGEWTEEWVEVARVGNELSKSYYLISDLSTMESFEAIQVQENPFYEEVSSLYDQLTLDAMDVGMSPLVIGGSSLTVGAGSYDFTEMLGDKTALLIGATEQLNLSGAISFGGDTGLSAMLASGSAIEVSAGTSIKGALADLVISARQDVLLRETALESSREVAIRSLRDLQLTQVKIHAPDRVHLRASRNLDINGLELSQSLPSLIMEATTIRLSNIDFPSTTAVQLNSLKGPIDGRYPNFGTSIPVSEQLGRVNFIENVRSGGNLMNNRPSFDQFGGNISIGKMINP